jgi:hypothetical protein
MPQAPLAARQKAAVLVALDSGATIAEAATWLASVLSNLGERRGCKGVLAAKYHPAPRAR